MPPKTIPRPVKAIKKPAPVKKPPENPNALSKDWVELEKRVMICSGSYSQVHKRFKGQNEQGAAVCIVAVLFSQLRKMNTWDKTVLDLILEVGTNLHLKSRQISENKCRINIEPPHVHKYFFLDDLRVSLRVDTGVTTSRIPRDINIIDHIGDLLKNFFARSSTGVFAYQNTYFAIWQLDKYYFLFDPRDNDLQGGKWTGVPGLGYCYCLRSPTTSTLAQIILNNIPLKQIYKFMIYPVKLENTVKVNTVPPETYDTKPPPLPPAQPEKTKIVKKVIPVKKPPSVTAPKEEVPEKPRAPPTRPRLASVTNFTLLKNGLLGILRASTHQCDPRFTKNNGAQALSNAVAALTMLRQYKAKTWIRAILDQILNFGEEIHNLSKDLGPGHITPKITLKEKDYAPKLEKYGSVGRLISDVDKILSLHVALSDFLIDHDCCVIFGPVILAIWKEENRYYMFDPNERDPEGRVSINEPGVACATWFVKITDLVALYMDNVPKHRHKDKFLLAKAIIKDWVPVAEDWNNFKALTFNKWILRGNFSQQDRRFPPESRNAQCTANATMALTFKELKPEQEWNDKVVDQVLIDGDEFYRGCVDHLKDTNKFKDKYLMVDELKRTFEIENKRVNLEIDDCLVNGVLNAKSDTGILNLRRGFEEFFNENDAGIVTANLQSMAVWRRDETFYYYDSHSRDTKGVVCGYGTACVLRMVTIDDLTKALLANVGPDKTNFYNISRIVVHLMDLTEDGTVKPPLENYEEVNELVAILRSNLSERDKKFTINAGKQTVPMCVAALAMNSLIPSFGWDKGEVDQILVVGDKVYAESMAENYKEEVPEELNVDDITTENMKKQLLIGSNSFEVEIELVSQGTDVLNLDQVLKENFQACQEDEEKQFELLLETPSITASIWRDDNLIYFFDPRPRDEKGQVYGKYWTDEVPEEENPDDLEEVEEEDEEDQDEEQEPDEMAGGDNFGTKITETEEQDVAYKKRAFEDEQDDEQENEEEEEQEEQDAEEVESIPEDHMKWLEEEENNGRACVLRFSRIEDLIKHVVNNIPPKSRSELEFLVKTVKLVNNPITHTIHDPELEKEEEFVGDWNEFKEIDYGKWILRCSKNFNDDLFPDCNRGKQQLPMCLVVLGFAYLYDVGLYNRPILDRVLAYGDRFYTTLRRIRFKELKGNKDLGLTEENVEQILEHVEFKIENYPNRFCLGEMMAIWELKLEAAVGDITSKIPEEVPNLQSGLETFFTEETYGILQCRNYVVAVFKSDDYFYMFDPHPTGPNGTKSPMGVACITRYKNLEDLVKTFMECLPSVGDHFFEIHAIKFEKCKCPRERQPLPEQLLPKVGGFVPVTAGKHILRGTNKPDCDYFSRGVHLHSAAIAFAAIAISQTVEADTWTRILVNEVVKVGDDLHQETLQKLGDKFNAWEEVLDIYRVNTDFNVGKLRANFALRYTEVRGMVDPKCDKKMNLRQGLEKFFAEDSHGILIVDKLVLAIWEEAFCKELNIYVFDPNSRGVTGLPSQGGVPCLMKFCNAKEAADHLKACMVGIDKCKTSYTIVPVDVLLEDRKSRKRLPSKIKQKTCPCPLPTITPKSAELEAKRALRAAAEEQRKKEKARQMALLGRKEMYQVANGLHIIRGLRNMIKDRELPVNIVAFVLMKLASDMSKWTYKQIDLILETGHQLYVDSYNVYKPAIPKLNLQQVLRRVLVKDQEVKIDIKRPIMCAAFTSENLQKTLETLFTKLTFCMLNFKDLLVSLYFKSGYYYLFDPYSRDLNGDKTENGSAVLMRFDAMADLVDKLVKNLGGVTEEVENVSRFVLIITSITNVQPASKLT